MSLVSAPSFGICVNDQPGYSNVAFTEPMALGQSGELVVSSQAVTGEPAVLVRIGGLLEPPQRLHGRVSAAVVDREGNMLLVTQRPVGDTAFCTTNLWTRRATAARFTRTQRLDRALGRSGEPCAEAYAATAPDGRTTIAWSSGVGRREFKRWSRRVTSGFIGQPFPPYTLLARKGRVAAVHVGRNSAALVTWTRVFDPQGLYGSYRATPTTSWSDPELLPIDVGNWPSYDAAFDPVTGRLDLVWAATKADYVDDGVWREHSAIRTSTLPAPSP
jgi:hypothetical protein